MNYAIFRTQPIKKLSDLGQIGAHNQRKKEAYKSNPDIDITKKDQNIEIVPLNTSYYNGYMKIVKDYKNQHDKHQLTVRADRKKSFSRKLDSSNSVVADEMLFTATQEFFKDLTKEEIEKWARETMKFVYYDIGYPKEQILHATIHMDEETPHLHVVAIPLVKKLDKRQEKEVFTISKQFYMGKNPEFLSELQDKYHQRMINNNFKLERGIKNSDNEHIPIKQYKKLTKKLSLEHNKNHSKLAKTSNQLDSVLSDSKEVLFDKEHIKIKKDTFKLIKQIVSESKEVAETGEKTQLIFNEIDNYAKSVKFLEKENFNIQKEVESLEQRNQELEQENRSLNDTILAILNAVKSFFREMLIMGNKLTKERTVEEVKDFYDNKDFNSNDIYDIAIETTEEQELFKYAKIEKDYTPNKDYDMRI